VDGSRARAALLPCRGRNALKIPQPVEIHSPFAKREPAKYSGSQFFNVATKLISTIYFHHHCRSSVCVRYLPLAQEQDFACSCKNTLVNFRLHGGFMKRPRIILADDHTLLLDALKKLIEPEFEVVGTFADGLSLVETAPQLNPSAIVLDIAMPLLNGLSAGQVLKQKLPLVKLVYLTMNEDPDLAGEAFRLGASAYLVKHSAGSELLQALREVVRGGYYITPLMTKGMDGSFVQNFKQRKSRSPLTLRQKEVLQLLAEGHSMKQAAFLLNVSLRTIAFHKYTMMDRLHVKSNAELIEYAMRSALVAA